MTEGTDVATILARAQAAPAACLAPYTTVTHSGRSVALALPDGDGDHLTLLANAEASMLGGVFAEGLIVHGIAVGRSGQKLTVKVIGGQPVTFVHQSDEAKKINGLMNTNANDVTRVPVGASIDYTYDEKAPGWRQV